jgi:hypothetical protein
MRARGAACLLLALAACTGQGSDIGPRLQPIDGNDYRVLVHDDAGRPVCNAIVRISGVSGFATSGRGGRAIVYPEPSGTRLLTVEGATASARDGDALATLGLQVDMPQRGELPFVLHLPDLAGSAGLTLTTGVQATASSLDDSATSGAILGIAAGTVVSLGASATVTLRTGGLRALHLPGDLPATPGFVRLPGAAAFVDPGGVSFVPGASLSLPNDLGLPAAAGAELFRVDPADGRWRSVATGVVEPGGVRIAAPAGAVEGGGLFCFAIEVPVSTEISGRLLDVLGAPLDGVLVRAAHAHTRTRADGRFDLPSIAAVDGAGTARTVTVECHGGRNLRPSGTDVTVALTPGALDLGDILLESEPVVGVRTLLVTRGRRDAARRMRLSSAEGFGVGIGVGDDRAEASFEEVRSGAFLGMLTSRPKDVNRMFRAETLVFAPRGFQRLDMTVFGREEDFLSQRGGRGSTNTVVVDRDGTGPLRYASVVNGSVPGEGFAGLTNSRGLITANYGSGAGAQVTASFASGNSGRTVRSAFTIVDLDSARTEVPLERVRAAPLGAFDRHGLVGGAITGSAGAGKVRRLRSTRRLSLEDWYDDVFEGRGLPGAVPRKLDPETSGGTAFLIGVPTPIGSLAAVEGTAAGGLTIERLGIAAGLRAVSDGVLARDLALDLPADTAFTLGGALVDLDATIAPGSLAFDLAVELASGELVDVARGVTGNFAASGPDAILTLPALGGALANARHLVALGGSATTGGVTRRQQVFAALRAGTPTATSMLAVPEIVQPAPGAVLPAAGFVVEWQHPSAALYTVVQLRAESPTEVRDWTAVVPGNLSTFRFRELPREAFVVLGPNITWTLTVRAERIGLGPLAGVRDAYRRVVQNWVGIGAAERQVDAFSSASITVTTQ